MRVTGVVRASLLTFAAALGQLLCAPAQGQGAQVTDVEDFKAVVRTGFVVSSVKGTVIDLGASSALSGTLLTRGPDGTCPEVHLEVFDVSPERTGWREYPTGPSIPGFGWGGGGSRLCRRWIDGEGSTAVVTPTSIGGATGAWVRVCHTVDGRRYCSITTEVLAE